LHWACCATRIKKESPACLAQIPQFYLKKLRFSCFGCPKDYPFPTKQVIKRQGWDWNGGPTHWEWVATQPRNKGKDSHN